MIQLQDYVSYQRKSLLLKIHEALFDMSPLKAPARWILSNFLSDKLEHYLAFYS